MKYSVKYNEIKHIVVTNDSGMRVELSECGASIYNIEILNDEGIYESMMLTPSDLSNFYKNPSYYGKTIGRWAGRIDKGLCEYSNRKYNLEINWGKVNSLHGGVDGLSSRNFKSTVTENENYIEVNFHLEAYDNVLAGLAKYDIKYKIFKNENTLLVLLNAICDEDTLMNLTNHAYFNLSGDGKRTILEHNLYLNCPKYTKLNNELITISIDDVNEVFDFTTKHKVKDFIMDPSLQNHTSRGYDHCFIKTSDTTDLIAVLEDEENHMQMKLYTSYPAVVFYSGCYPDSFKFNKERLDNQIYHSLCLEPQFIPNGVNMEGVEKAILKANEEYKQYIKYEFKKI